MCINNPDGSYDCKCSPGWSGPQCSQCLDIEKNLCTECYNNDNALVISGLVPKPKYILGREENARVITIATPILMSWPL